MTPEEAYSRRIRLKAEKRESLLAHRTASRETRRRQVASGARPRRRKNESMTVSVITVNVTAASTFMHEYDHGDRLHGYQLFGIQEHAIPPDKIDCATNWLKAKGASGVVDDAYWKQGGYGGGTAIIGIGYWSLRPLPPPRWRVGGVDFLVHRRRRMRSGFRHGVRHIWSTACRTSAPMAMRR